MAKKSVKKTGKTGKKGTIPTAAASEDEFAGLDLGNGSSEPPGGEAETPDSVDEPTATTTTMDTEITLANIDSSLKKAGAGSGKYLKITADRPVEVRFLEQLIKTTASPGGLHVMRHNDFKNRISPTTCFKHYGQECDYCEQNVPIADWYAWNVYNFTAKKVQVAAFKASQKGIVQQLAAYYKANQSIMSTNFVLSREGEGTDTKYFATAKMRTKPDEVAKMKTVLAAAMKKRYNLLEELKPQALKGGTDDQGGTSGTQDDFGFN